MSDNTDDRAEVSHLRVKWKTVGLLGALAGVGCLGVLITVVSVSNIDTLSTVALVLAILAFAIQIMIFVAQTAAATEQTRSTLDINSETKSILSELRARTQATNDVLNSQFNKLLDKMLLVTQETEQNATEEPEADPSAKFEVYLQEMRSAILDLKKEYSSTSRTTSPASAEVPTIPPVSFARRFRGFKDKLSEPLSNPLQLRYRYEYQEIGRIEVDTILVFAEALQSAMSPHEAWIPLSRFPAAIRALLDRRLVEQVSDSEKSEGYGWFVLTVRGVNLSRILLSPRTESLLRRFPWLQDIEGDSLPGEESSHSKGQSDVG